MTSTRKQTREKAHELKRVETTTTAATVDDAYDWPNKAATEQSASTLAASTPHSVYASQRLRLAPSYLRFK